jgi:predicted DCC family thiol-disulfide oxidoreductase YuxK
MEAPPSDLPVVLFDGVCNLCNGAVQFMIDHERSTEPHLHFAPIQSDAGRVLLERVFGAQRARELQKGATGSGDPDTIVFIEGERGYTHSTAALRIARHLRGPWRWLTAFVIVPRWIRDLCYGVIVRNRYRWFGKTESCRIPTPELKTRFLA